MHFNEAFQVGMENVPSTRPWVSQNFRRISMCVWRSRFLFLKLAVLQQNEKYLGFAKNNSSLAFSHSLSFTIHHPYK